MWLSEARLSALTKRVRPAAQIRVLNHMGIPYRRRPDGSVVVFEADLCTEPEAPSRKRTTPDFSQLPS